MEMVGGLLLLWLVWQLSPRLRAAVTYVLEREHRALLAFQTKLWMLRQLAGVVRRLERVRAPRKETKAEAGAWQGRPRVAEPGTGAEVGLPANNGGCSSTRAGLSLRLRLCSRAGLLVRPVAAAYSV